MNVKHKVYKFSVFFPTTPRFPHVCPNRNIFVYLHISLSDEK
jgi:hypothetical protein